MSSLNDFPHPDLIQSGIKEATQGNRYEFYSGACYLIHARAAGMQGASGLTVKFFSNPDPDGDEGDTIKCILSVPDDRTDAPDLYFPSGLYIEVEGIEGNSDVALVEADWVARDEYCRSFPRIPESLAECWENAAGRSGSALYDNYDRGTPPGAEWDNEGAAGSGGVSGAPKVSIFTTDPTIDDDSAAGYSAGDLWVNSTDDGVFVLADATEGAAVWTEIGAGGGDTADWPVHNTLRIGVGPGSLSTEETIDLALPPNMTLASAYISMTDTLPSNASRYWVFKLYRGADTVATLSTASTTITADVMTSFGTLSNTSFDGTQTLTLGLQTFNDGTQPTSLNGDYITIQCVFEANP